MPVHVIIRHEAIEDHYSAPCAVALTAEAAQTWIDNTVATSLRLQTAHDIGREAVTAWEAANPDPFTEPMPPRTKWPNGVGKKDPRYPEYRALRDSEEAAQAAWSDRREAAATARHLLTDNVFQQAVAHLNPCPRGVEDRPPHVTAADFHVEVWNTVEEDPSVQG